jgi:hypothetical protein
MNIIKYVVFQLFLHRIYMIEVTPSVRLSKKH